MIDRDLVPATFISPGAVNFASLLFLERGTPSAPEVQLGAPREAPAGTPRRPRPSAPSGAPGAPAPHRTAPLCPLLRALVGGDAGEKSSFG